MNKVKKVTVKDWIEVFILVIVIVCITFYLCSWYKNYKKESMSAFVLDDLVMQIRYEELDPYLLENNDKYLYICVVDDNDCREFETEIKEIIEKRQLNDMIVYLNLTDEENKEDIIKQMNKKYGDKKKINGYPAFVRIKDSKIVSMVEKTNKKLTKKKFEKFLDVNEMN